MRFAAVMVCVLLGVGCASSPQARFYTLEPRASGQAPAALAGPPVSVADVELPPTLDRRKLVYRTASAEVAIQPYERWSAPLDLMIRRTLATNLARRLQPGAVVLPGQPEPPDGFRSIVVVVERFAPGPDGHVSLRANWYLQDLEGRLSHRQRETVRVEAGGNTGERAAAAMSDALAELARRMADTLAGR